MLIDCSSFSVKKTTSTQFEVLVRELEAKPNLARGAPVFGADKLSFDVQWNEVANKLNAYGPPKRSMVEWKKVSMIAVRARKCLLLSVTEFDTYKYTLI